MENTAHAHTAGERRLWNLDLLRILATFLIVVLHLVPLVHPQVPIASPLFKAANVITSLCRWCVPAFFMISGALFLSDQKMISVKRLYTKTLLRMLVSFFAWSAMYALVHCLLNGKGKWTFLNQLLRGHYHMWYILAIISLYWITPLLRMITASKKATEYFLLSGFVFSFLFSRALSFVQLFSLPHADVVVSLQSAYAQMNPYRGLCYVYYYVLGYYLQTCPISKKLRRAIYASGAAGLAATIVLTDWHSNLTGAVSAHFSDPSAINVMAMAAAVFVLFRYGFEGVSMKGRVKDIILHASGCSFGVYLVHAFMIERLNQFAQISPGDLLAYLPAISGAVFLLSYAVSAILNRIPVVNRYVV